MWAGAVMSLSFVESSETRADASIYSFPINLHVQTHLLHAYANYGSYLTYLYLHN